MRRADIDENNSSTNMRDIARRLISEEQHRNDSTDNEGQAAFRVCEKLRKSLSVLTGTNGFGALLTRAQSLAGREIPWLNELAVGANGAFVLPPHIEAKLSRGEAARGGARLVAHLLELLATFIGEALTLRLVQQAWPKVALNRESKQP